MKTLSIVLLSQSLLTTLPSFAAGDAPKQSVNVTEGTVHFLAIGKPSAIRIKGSGAAPQGTIQLNGASVQGEVAVAIESLDTGIELRTKHMKEKYLEVGKFPKAQFIITEMKLPAPLKADGYTADDVPMTGTLILHGVQKPVTGKASLRSSSGKVTAHVQFPVTVSAHGIELPTYLGITLADQVEVEADLGGTLQ